MKPTPRKPTPKEKELFQKYLAGLQAANPGVNITVLDVSQANVDWLHWSAAPFDEATAEDLAAIQLAVDRGNDPRQTKGLPPPPFHRPTFPED